MRDALCGSSNFRPVPAVLGLKRPSPICCGLTSPPGRALEHLADVVRMAAPRTEWERFILAVAQGCNNKFLLWAGSPGRFGQNHDVAGAVVCIHEN